MYSIIPHFVCCTACSLSLKATALKLLLPGKCSAAVTPRYVPLLITMEQPYVFLHYVVWNSITVPSFDVACKVVQFVSL